MAIEIRCPGAECGKIFRVQAHQLGQPARCRSCGQRFVLGTEGETVERTSESETEAGESLSEFAAALADTCADSTLPQTIGRFQILAVLGRGAFGVVYRAHDPVLDREVALKVPHAGILANDQARARFLREPKAAARLRHPHIVPIYDAGSDGQLDYIASAYIPGCTLQELLKQEPPNATRAVAIVRSLAEALHYAHELGIVHRDVKPANVMVDEDGRALLMDFGLARIAESQEVLTHDGAVMGTPAYMAPEQANRSFGEVGPASDQYGLGVTLYELLCGQRPFSGAPATVIYSLLHQEPDSPRTRDPSVPRDLNTICQKAMSKRPEQRYANCGELAEDLRRWQADEPILARRQTPADRTVRWCRRNPVVTALTMLLLLGLTVAAWQALVARRALSARRLADNRLATHDVVLKEQAETKRQKAHLVSQLADRVDSTKVNISETQQEAESLEQEASDLEAEIRAVEEERSAAQARIDSLQNQLDEHERKTRSFKAHLTDALSWEWLKESQEQLEANDPVGAKRTLDLAPPEKRDWKWALLRHRCEVAATRVVIPSDSKIVSHRFISDTASLAVATEDGWIRVFDGRTAKLLKKYRVPSEEAVWNGTVQFTADARCLVATSRRPVRMVDGSNLYRSVILETLTERVLTSVDSYHKGYRLAQFLDPTGPRTAQWVSGTKVALFAAGQLQFGPRIITLPSEDYTITTLLHADEKTIIVALRSAHDSSDNSGEHSTQDFVAAMDLANEQLIKVVSSFELGLPENSKIQSIGEFRDEIWVACDNEILQLSVDLGLLRRTPVNLAAMTLVKDHLLGRMPESDRFRVFPIVKEDERTAAKLGESFCYTPPLPSGDGRRPPRRVPGFSVSSRLAATCDDNVVVVESIGFQRPEQAVPSSGNVVALSPLADCFAAWDQDRERVKVHALPEGNEIASYNISDRVHLASVARGREVFAYHDDGVLHVYSALNPSTPIELRILNVTRLAVDPQGERLAVDSLLVERHAGRSRLTSRVVSVYALNWEAGILVPVCQLSFDGRREDGIATPKLGAMRFSHDGKVLRYVKSTRLPGSVSQRKSWIETWDLEREEVVSRFDLPTPGHASVRDFWVAADSRELIAFTSRSIAVFDMATGVMRLSLDVDSMRLAGGDRQVALDGQDCLFLRSGSQLLRIGSAYPDAEDPSVAP